MISYPLFFLVCSLSILYSSVSTAQENYIPIKIESGPIEETVPIPGKIYPELSEVIKFKETVWVKKLLVNQSDIVKKGDLLAILETKDLDKEVNDLAIAVLDLKSKMEAASLQLETAKKATKTQKDKVEQGLAAENTLDQLRSAEFEKFIAIENARFAYEDKKKSLEEKKEKQKQANIYASLSGLITQTLVDAKSVSGSFTVQPKEALITVVEKTKYTFSTTILDIFAKSLSLNENVDIEITGHEGIFPCKGKSLTANLPNSDNQGYGGYGNTPQKPYGSFDFSCTFTAQDFIPNKISGQMQLKYSYPAALRLPWNAISIEKDVPYVTLFSKESGEKRVAVKLGKRGSHYVEVLEGVNNGDMVKAYLW